MVDKKTEKLEERILYSDIPTVANVIIDGSTGLVYPGDTKVQDIRGYD